VVREDVHVEKDSSRYSARRRYLCRFLRSTGGKQAPQPGGTGPMQIFRRKNNHGRLLQSTDEGPQNLWRTGANEATTFVTSGNLLMVKGSTVPAGSYTIFTVPDPDKWTLIVNKHTGESGTPYKYESEELARVPMSVTKLPSPVENFTISFDHTGGSCTMRMSWENTQASLEFTEKNADLPVMN
jgi:hypothetical protein